MDFLCICREKIPFSYLETITGCIFQKTKAGSLWDWQRGIAEVGEGRSVVGDVDMGLGDCRGGEM